MKNYILMVALILIMVLTVAFVSKEQEPKSETYATVVYSTANRVITIYYGSVNSPAQIEIKRGENFQDKLMDALGVLGKQGYTLISSNTNIINASQGYNYTEFYYTLRKP
jgi:hypothetical protein